MALSEITRDEFYSMMTNFSRRLVKCETEVKNPDPVLIRAIRAVSEVNQDSLFRLKTGLEIEEKKGSERNDFSVFPSVWRPDWMKPAYAAAMEYGPGFKLFTSVGDKLTFTAQTKGHLDNVLSLLNDALKQADKDSTKRHCKPVRAAIHKIEQLNEWLKDPQMLPTVRKQKNTTVLEGELMMSTRDYCLRKQRFTLAENKDSNDKPQEIKVYVGSVYIVIKLDFTNFFKSEEWDVGRIDEIGFNVTEDEKTMILSGVGGQEYRLVFPTADLCTEWRLAISELKAALRENPRQV